MVGLATVFMWGCMPCSWGIRGGIYKQEQDDRRKMASDMVVKLKDKLTETQFRRLWMHEVEEKTLEEIAALENVAFQSVHESIESAKKKILKIYRN